MVPGETKTIEIEFENKYLQNHDPELLIEGWNIVQKKIEMKLLD
jgi:hypothetical protein